MKFFASAILLLAASPAFAADDMIVAGSETPETPAIELTDFTGGVSTADVHESGGTVIIQMIQPASQSTAAAVAAVRYSGSGH